MPLAGRAATLTLAATVGATLAAATGAIAEPAAAATNGLISYSAPGLAYVANADGSNRRILTNGQQVAWSPDGSRFVYVEMTSGSTTVLKTKRLDGSGEVQLTDPTRAEDPDPARPEDPVWTPDGSAIIYGDIDTGRLYLVGADGGWWRGGPLFDPGPGGSDSDPTVAPDGTVVFRRCYPESCGLYRYDPRSLQVALMIVGAENAAFSPDGSKLAYVVATGHHSDPVRQVWISDANGANPVQLTDEPNHGAVWPAWSPDATEILFVNQGAPPWPVKKINVGSKEVTTVAGHGYHPAWQPVARNNVDRVWGQDHVATAIAAARYNYASTGDARAVVLSRDDTFLDALVGSALAIKEKAPLLVTNRSALDPRVEAEIRRLLGGSGTVYLLGGESALAPAIANRLQSLGFSVQRIWGQTHFDTAIEINRRITPTPEIAIVTTGINFYDALAAGAAAGANRGTVIVLTNGTEMPAASANYLNGLNPDPRFGTLVVTAGGPGDRALEDAHARNQLPNWPRVFEAARLVGQNEMDTALQIADFFFAAPLTAAVATNWTWFDALTGGAMIGFNYGPLLITPPDALYPGVRDYLSRGSGNIWTGVLLGGPAALPDALINPIGEAISLPGQWDYRSVTPGTNPAGPAATRHAQRERPAPSPGNRAVRITR